MSNQYIDILKNHGIVIPVNSIYPIIYKKSTYNKSIVKFTDPTTGSIVKESPNRTYKSGYGHVSMGAIGFSSSDWRDHKDENSWSDLIHEELLEFDENYRNKHLLETKNNISKELIDSLLNLENLSSNNELNRISNVINLLHSLNKGTEL